MVHKFYKSLVEFGKAKSPNDNFRQCKRAFTLCFSPSFYDDGGVIQWLPKP